MTPGPLTTKPVSVRWLMLVGWGIGICLLAACAGDPHPCNISPATPAASQSILGQALDQALMMESQGITGVVQVTREDKIQLRRGYACAQLTPPRANTPETIFDIGSVAKLFTAAAIFKLQEQGKLELTDPIARHLPGVPADKRKITLMQLLGNTSGLANYHADNDFQPMDRIQAERAALALPLEFEPGSDSSYSNAGFALLAAVVERRSGTSFQAFVRSELLLPAGMTDTAWYGDPGIDQQRLALGYGGQAPGESTFSRPLSWALIGGGGMVSTVDDLHRWLRAMDHPGVLSQTSRERLFTAAAKGRWTLGGWRQRAIDGHITFERGGSTDFGYTAKLHYFPEQRILVILLLNAYHPDHGPATHHALSVRVLAPRILARSTPP